MATITITLPKGLKTLRHVQGAEAVEVRHTEAVLRELTTGDMIAAAEAAEKCVLGDDGAYHLVQSPGRAGIELLCRQVVRIGEVEGPLTLDELLKLEREDFVFLQAMASQLDNAGAEAMRGATERGRDHPAS
ncbi:MAG: hypothetical protein AB1918_07830 [Pseudomonadota bacterium]